MPKRITMDTAADRLRSRITVDSNGCWNYPLVRGQRYGKIMVSRKLYYVHRLSYQLFRGDIGDLHVLHRCDNTACINPDHLFLGTHLDNMADMRSKDRAGGRELRNRIGKLTDEQVKELRYKHMDGAGINELAEEFGISRGYVRRIVAFGVTGGRPTRYHAEAGHPGEL